MSDNANTVNTLTRVRHITAASKGRPDGQDISGSSCSKTRRIRHNHDKLLSRCERYLCFIRSLPIVVGRIRDGYISWSPEDLSSHISLAYMNKEGPGEQESKVTSREQCHLQIAPMSVTSNRMV